MRLNRRIVKITKKKIEENEEPTHLTMSETLSFLWELTEEVFSLSGRYNVKSRLQRHVVSITRKQS